MCDYCDCRSHPQIAALSTDHEAIVHLLTDLDRAADQGEVATATVLLATLKELLDRHTSREERGVFVQLRRADVAGDYVERFVHEHHQLDGLLAQCSGADWRRHVEHLNRLLAQHIAREESDMFPAAHQLLRPDQWDAVDAAEGATQPAGGS